MQSSQGLEIDRGALADEDRMEDEVSQPTVLEVSTNSEMVTGQVEVSKQTCLY